MWPATNAPLTSAEILEILDAEITGTLWPQLLSSQGDWHLAYVDRALEADRAAYRMPQRMWGPVKDLLLVDSAGKADSLLLVNIEELGRLEPIPGAGGSGRFVAYLDGDSVGLWPTPTAADESYSLRIRYYHAPNTLCLESEARRVVTPQTSTTMVISSNAPTWTSTTELDIIGEGVSHQLLAEEQGVASHVSVALTFDAAYPDAVEAGDWLSISGTTPVAQIPDHLVPQLVQLAVAECLASVKDSATARASAKAADLERRGLPTIDPRQEAEPRVIVPRNTPFARYRR